VLIRFRFANIRSFHEEQELSLVAGPFKDQPQIVRHPDGCPEGVLPVAVIYGANASGKTSVILAIRFLAEAVGASQRQWKPDGPIPREPFLHTEDSNGEPSEVEADFLLGNVRHRYGFRVDSEAVIEEWLYVYPNNKKQTWFHRQQDKPIFFGSKMPGENRTIENLTRKNWLWCNLNVERDAVSLAL
jgi:AAA15 family ATPase/GTPase